MLVECGRRPNGARPPVGYNEQLLDEYVPGKSWYLTEAMRRELHAQGKTAELNQPAGTFARDVYERLLIDLAWSSCKLEGNTYDRLDTKNLLEYGIRAEGKDAAEAVMLLNHKKAIALLVEQAEYIGFNRYTILNLRAALSEGLLSDDGDEGRLREKVVAIGTSVYVPISIPQKIEEHFDVILAKARDIPDPFEQSFFMMVTTGQLPIRRVIEQQVVRLESPPADNGAITNIILQSLLNLHEGSTYRYGILPGEFHAWKQKLDQPR